jgi:hypothetical protein
VLGIELPGIVDAAVKGVTISHGQLQRVSAELEQSGQVEITVLADIELFLRTSNVDVLRSPQAMGFRVALTASENGLETVASNEKPWEVAWEQGIERIKAPALQLMKRDVWNMDATLTEDTYIFQAAMVLLASELVGPYADRIVTFLGYPRGLVQVIAARLHEARIWEKDEVRFENWFDTEKETVAFLLDLMVAQGLLIRRWSEEKKQFAYCAPDVTEAPRFAV